MSADGPRLRWHFAIRLLHWLTVAALALQITIAFGPMKGAGMATMLWLPLHISTGVTILVIIVIRLGFRAVTRAPAEQTSPIPRAASVLVHACLYAVILAIVITGWLAYRPMPLMAPARLFGRLPVPVAPSVAGLSAREFIAIHSTLFWAFSTLLGVHVLAAAMHVVLFRDGVVSTMLFGRSRAEPSSK